MNPRIHKVPGKLWLLAQGDCRTWKLALGRLQGWMPSRSGPGKSDVPLDILIPAIPKDYPTLPSVINSVREHVRHPIGDIFLIAPDSPEIRLIAERYGCLFCNESNQLPIKKSDINYTWQKIDRSGWIFQQLLKLNGDQLGVNEHFLVIDADTCLLKPHVFMKDGKTLLLFSDENHLAYYGVFSKLLGHKKISCVSLVTHYMVFHKPKLIALKKAIEEHTGLPWYQAIVDNIARTSVSGFSEYETYGNYVLAHYPNSFWLEYCLNLTRLETKANFEQSVDGAATRYRSVSYHRSDTLLGGVARR